MPVFSYKALTLAGETAHGVETAESLDQLREILAARDLILKSGRASRRQFAARPAAARGISPISIAN